MNIALRPSAFSRISVKATKPIKHQLTPETAARKRLQTAKTMRQAHDQSMRLNKAMWHGHVKGSHEYCEEKKESK